jgi:SapC
MDQLVPVVPETHQQKFWQRYTSYGFAAKEHLAPLVGAEIAKAIQAMPVGFIKQEERFILVGLMSPVPGQNMFVSSQGQWLGTYIPSALRGYPFRLARVEGREELILCINEASGLISDQAGESFFDDQGQPAPAIKEIMGFWQQIESGRAGTDLAVAALADAGLMTQWPLKVKQGEEEKAVDGLYTLDEAKLNSLDEDAFLQLRKAQALPLAYAQLLSMGNMDIFQRLSTIHAQQKQAQASVPPAPNSGQSMGNLLGNDDILSFDNL